MGDIFGNVLGFSLGEWMRGLRSRRLEGRAVDGHNVKLSARAHIEGVPDYRVIRGSLVRRNGAVSWRPGLLARATPFTVVPLKTWRPGPFDLSGSRCVGRGQARSVSRGPREIFYLIGADPVRSVDVAPDLAEVARRILP
jgi:hypothetical protein